MKSSKATTNVDECGDIEYFDKRNSWNDLRTSSILPLSKRHGMNRMNLTSAISNLDLDLLLRYVLERGERDRSDVIEKRNRDHAPVPWGCTEQLTWRDLGTEYFPRYIRQVECTQTHCFRGHYRCRGQQMQVNVLRRVSAECPAPSRRMPSDLGRNWRFVTVPTTMWCLCGR